MVVPSGNLTRHLTVGAKLAGERACAAAQAQNRGASPGSLAKSHPRTVGKVALLAGKASSNQGIARKALTHLLRIYGKRMEGECDSRNRAGVRVSCKSIPSITL